MAIPINSRRDQAIDKIIKISIGMYNNKKKGKKTTVLGTKWKTAVKPLVMIWVKLEVEQQTF